MRGVEDAIAVLGGGISGPMPKIGNQLGNLSGANDDSTAAEKNGVTKALDEGVATLMEGVAMFRLEEAAGKAMAVPRREMKVKLVNFIVDSPEDRE